MILINPEIVAETEEMATREEGCLSLPSQYAEVVRPEKVRVRWQTIHGDKQERDVDGLLAHPAVRKFVDWVANKDPDFTASISKKQR